MISRLVSPENKPSGGSSLDYMSKCPSNDLAYDTWCKRKFIKLSQIVHCQKTIYTVETCQLFYHTISVSIASELHPLRIT